MTTIGSRVAAKSVAIERRQGGRRLERNLPHAVGRDFEDQEHHLRSMAESTCWYDGSCPLCRRQIALLRRLDRRSAIRLVDVGKTEPAACLLARGELLARFHASESGRLLSGARAFAAMWQAVTLLRPLGLAFQEPFASALIERFCRAFRRARPTLQKLAHRLERP